MIHNSNTVKPRNGVEAQVIAIFDETGRFPDQLCGAITLPYQLPFPDTGQGCIAIGADQRKSVDVASFHDHFWNRHIRLGNRDGTAIPDGTYQITIQITCLDDKAAKKVFEIGLTEKKGGRAQLYMRNIFDQPATSNKQAPEAT